MRTIIPITAAGLLFLVPNAEANLPDPSTQSYDRRSVEIAVKQFPDGPCRIDNTRVYPFSDTQGFRDAVAEFYQPLGVSAPDDASGYFAVLADPCGLWIHDGVVDAFSRCKIIVHEMGHAAGRGHEPDGIMVGGELPESYKPCDSVLSPITSRRAVRMIRTWVLSDLSGSSYRTARRTLRIKCRPYKAPERKCSAEWSDRSGSNREVITLSYAYDFDRETHSVELLEGR